MRDVAKLPWWEWSPYRHVDVRAYEARVLTELRRMCDDGKRPPIEENPS